MESEVELNAMINEMHVIATVPELYNIVVDLNAVQSLLQLLGHENTGSPWWKSSTAYIASAYQYFFSFIIRCQEL